MDLITIILYYWKSEQGLSDDTSIEELVKVSSYCIYISWMDRPSTLLEQRVIIEVDTVFYLISIVSSV